MSERLPGVLSEIADLVGPDAARRLGERYAGATVKFPCQGTLDKPRRDAEIRRLASEGWEVDALSIRFAISPRRVRQILGR